MPLYRGTRSRSGVRRVYVSGADGQDKPLDPRLDLINHSPTGFEWGFSGSGPAQLALAILAHEMGEGPALQHYQAFKWEYVANFDKRAWAISSGEIRAFLERRKVPS